MQEKHIKEAEDAGLKYVGKATNNNANYRQYECENGHKIDLQVQHVRRNNWKCKYCFEDRLKQQAESIGYELLGSSELGAYYRKYKKNCGCIEDIRYSNVATKSQHNGTTSVCKTCYRKEMERCASDSDITLLEDIDTYNIRIKFNKCGHYKNAKKSQVFRKNLVCRECWTEILAKDASYEGLVYLGYLSDREHSYKLPCGCIKGLQPCDVRRGSWICKEHENTHYNKPCDIYLNLGFNKNIWFIKVGIANNTLERIKGYGSGDTAWANMLCIGFDTKYEALLYEKQFHKKFKHLSLDKNLMKDLMTSGFTECYPISAYQQIENYLRVLYNKFGGSVRFRKEENDN